MAYEGSGHVLQEVARFEHDPVAEAKKVRLYTWNADSTSFVTPQSHELTNSTALGVVLIDLNGNPYVASGGGGGGSDTVTVGGGFIEVTNQVSATVSIPDTVAVSIAQQLSATVSLPDQVSATVSIPDTVAVSIAQQLSATVSIPDQISATVSLPDTVDVAIAQQLSATVSIPDTVAVSIAQQLAATVSIPDQISATVSIPDTIDVAIAQQLSATVSIPDAVTIDGTITGTVTVGGESKATGLSTRLIWVGTVAEQLPDLGDAFRGVALKASSVSADAIFIGSNSSVNGTPDNANSGVELRGGEGLRIGVDNASKLWAIAPTATSLLSIIQDDL